MPTRLSSSGMLYLCFRYGKLHIRMVLAVPVVLLLGLLSCG